MNKQDCLFCKIAAKEIESKIVYEDESIIAVEDINPEAPVHVLLMPKKHIESLNDVTINDKEILGHIQIIAAKIARGLKISDRGYRLVNNCGEWGGQDILHIHYHLLGGKELSWPPG